MRLTQAFVAIALGLVTSTAGALVAAPFAASPAHATEIRVVVDDEVVTSYDVERRAAFLRLQRQSGNLNAKATDELIDEAIKRNAIQRAGIRIPDSMVNDAYSNFARSNNLSSKQLSDILNRSGVTPAHFREFIRLQIGWGQTIRARSNTSRGLMNEQDVVAKMLERGGQKPTSTEYILQQVIFVVPENQRSKLAARRTEANNMRSRINGCEDSLQLATQVRDVTVRDLGRVLELELPDRWAKDVKGLQAGQKTRVLDTERGVEFLIVCRARSVSDDRVAQLQFSTEALEESGGDVGDDFFKQLKANARIQRR